MPTSPEIARQSQVPLVVDLDGTLIRTDLLWESVARLLGKNPLWLLALPFWWAQDAHISNTNSPAEFKWRRPPCPTTNRCWLG